MGYPTGVFSPAARSNGQSIDASHVNDLQTEVAALETALLGTITHSLNVSGASTLATLQAAASTFTVRPVMPPPDVIRVQSTIVDLTNNTTLAVNWTRQVIALNSSIHSTAVNPEQLTPQSTGVYAVSANLQLSAAFSASSGNLRLRVLDSSGSEIAGSVAYGAGGVAAQVSALGLKQFDSVSGSTQWVRVEVLVRDGSTHSLSTVCSLSMHKL